jgi:hypothetical protein
VGCLSIERSSRIGYLYDDLGGMQRKQTCTLIRTAQALAIRGPGIARRFVERRNTPGHETDRTQFEPVEAQICIPKHRYLKIYSKVVDEDASSKDRGDILS